MVVTERGTALVLATAFAAAVVGAKVQTPQFGLRPAHHQVAHARLGTGLHLDVGLGRGHALEVLQRLLHIAQLQHIARGHGQRRAQGSAGVRLGQPNAGNSPGHHLQLQAPEAQVLRRRQHPAGHETLGNQSVLSALYQQGHSLRAEATALRRIGPIRPRQRAE